MGWISPTGFSDPSGKWSDEANAYDEDTGSYAQHDRSAVGYPFSLHLTHAAITCSKVRVWRGTIPINVAVYYEGAFHSIGRPSPANQWVELEIGATKSVTEARLEPTSTESPGCRVHEFDFWEVEVAAPTVTTQAVSDKQETTATGNGNITATGGENCSKRGVCWNTGGNPTVADDKSEQTDSFGTGAFTRSMTGLTAGTLYYVKAYAYNSAGYGYGSQVSFTSTYNERGKEQVILATVGESETLTLDETGKLQAILAVIGEADGWLYVETGKLQTILAKIGETDVQTMNETAKLQTILAVLGESDIQTMQELGITQVILSAVGEADGWLYVETGKLQTILAKIGETDTLTMNETAREQVIKAVLGSTDIQTMTEALEQVILAVVGKEEGRLLISRRTTGKTRVLDSIREEGVERVLDSDIV